MAFVAFAVLFGVIPRLAYGVPLLPSDHKPFIIGGEDAPEAYAPYMVAMIFGGRVKSQLCGGSIITRSLMLTAAHCVEPFILEDGGLLETLHTRVGSNQWNSGGTIINIKNYYMHPKWDSKNIKYDAAILVPREELVLTDLVAIIRLAFDFVKENERTLVTGWGRTGPRYEGGAVNLEPTPDDLQFLYKNTIDQELCQEQMIAVSGNRAPPVQRDVEICTFHSRGHGMCYGDSGSALVRMSSREQIGIVSWGYHCAYGAPDVHVRLSGIKDFIKLIIKMHEH